MGNVVKAIVAAVIVSSFCLTPLLAIPADAATYEVGSDGVSFKGSSIDEKKFNNLFTDDYKKMLGYKTLEAIVPGDFVEVVTRYDVTVPMIEEISNIRTSLGMEVTDKTLSRIESSSIVCDISFKATCLSDTTLFELVDGTQKLYKELDNGITVKAGSELVVEGTATIRNVDILDEDFIVTESGDCLVTWTSNKVYDCREFSGTVDYTYTCDKGKLTKTIDLETEFRMGGDYVTELEYYVDDMKKATATVSCGDTADLRIYEYNVNGVSGSYNDRIPMATIYRDYMVQHDTAAALGLALTTEEMKVPDITFYKPAGTVNGDCLFNDAYINPDYRSETAVKELLDDVGSIGETYSSSKSVANNIYTPVSSRYGPTDVIFYVLIAVLATALIGAVVLLIKN